MSAPDADAMQVLAGDEEFDAQVPAWAPGRFHGYHAFAIGVFAEKLCRRIAACTLQVRYEDEL